MKWKHASYEDMLLELELPSLQSRRSYLKLCTFFKLCTGYYVHVYPNLVLNTIRSTSTRSPNFLLCIRDENFENTNIDNTDIENTVNESTNIENTNIEFT